MTLTLNLQVRVAVQIKDIIYINALLFKLQSAAQK